VVAEEDLIMARKLSDAPRRSNFADSAARFAEIARSVKAQQIAAQQGSDAPALPRFEPPDEMWARNFASQSIGPAGTQSVAAMAPVPHRFDCAPDLASLRPDFARTAEFSRKANPLQPEGPVLGRAPMDIRAGGKQEPPKRSWLGRLFRGA
jgi:hypothetical protein